MVNSGYGGGLHDVRLRDSLREKWNFASRNKKTARRRSLCCSDRAGDQAALSAVLWLRRRIAPMPTKPTIIIAQVDGSGIAEIEKDVAL